MIAPLREFGRKAEIGMTFGIEIASVIVACLGLPLSELNVYNGALSAGVFVGVVPAVVGYSFLNINKFPLILLLIGAGTLCVLGFVFSDNYFPNSCVWPHFDNLPQQQLI